MSFFQQFSAELKGNDPLIYVDVGAMGGISAYWQAAAPYCRIVAFEPDEREFVKLTSSDRVTYLPYVLSHTSRDVRFFIARDQGKSSLLPPNMAVIANFPDAARYETVREVPFSKEKVKTLDEALKLSCLPPADFIKLDTQGSELDILKGAGDSLKNACGVEVEVEFIQLYQGQPLFADVHAFLTAQGFELMDLRRASWKRKNFTGFIGRGQLVFGDALYLRNIDALLNAWDLEKNADIPQKIAKIIVAAMVYRLPDYACALIDKAKAKGVLPSEIHARFKAHIEDEAGRWGMPHLPGRSILAKIFNRCSEMFRPASHLGWADGDRYIGNTRNL